MSFESYRDVLRQPLRDAQVVDLNRDFFAVAGFGHSNGSQILWTQKEMRYVCLIIKLINAGNTTKHPNPAVIRFNTNTLVHLGSHPADCRNIITSAEEVPDVLLQLELPQPLIDGLCILRHRRKHKLSHKVRWKHLVDFVK